MTWLLGVIVVVLVLLVLLRIFLNPKSDNDPTQHRTKRP